MSTLKRLKKPEKVSRKEGKERQSLAPAGKETTSGFELISSMMDVPGATKVRLVRPVETGILFAVGFWIATIALALLPFLCIVLLRIA